MENDPISLAHLKRIAEDGSYVLGFAFDEKLQHVVLLEKAKPAWAAGMWNGLGGKIEPGEDGLQAMAREFKEECGVDIAPSQWLTLGAFQKPGWFVECFAARTDAIFLAQTMEKERVRIYPVGEFLANTVLHEDTHSGLEAAWLVPYARRFLLHPSLRNDFQSVPHDAYDAPSAKPARLKP